MSLHDLPSLAAQTQPEKPSAAFASIARRLLQHKTELMEATDCRAENALEDARHSLTWHFRLDAIAKGSILGLGAGGLIFSGWGPAAVFLGLSTAYVGYRMAQQSIINASMVDQAYETYNRMTPGQFSKYLATANSGPNQAR